MKKALVAFVVEQSLLEIGGTTMLNQVSKLLMDKYGCDIMDCYEKPYMLSEVLRYLFGDSYTKLIKSINDKLEEFSYQKPIQNFIQELRV